jgi:hypothetical protein
MRSPFRLYVSRPLTSRSSEPEEMTVAKQRFGKRSRGSEYT